MIVGVLLALGSAVLYGASDYLGAVAARRLRTLPTTAATYLFATLVVLVALPFSGGAWSIAAVLWGAVAGACAIVGFLAFYAAMAAGPMSLVAPLIAALEAVVPVGVALILGERLAVWGWVAIAVAVAAGVLISAPRGDRRARIRARSLGLAVVSGIALGCSFVALDLAPQAAGLVPGLVELVVGLALLGLLAALVRGVPRIRSLLGALDADAVVDGRPVRRSALALAAAGGVLLGGGNALLLLALHATGLAVVSALACLYPLGTILLASLLLRERLAPAQLLGVALAVLASVTLAAT